MSSEESRLCRLIVREHFGPIVEKVANVLIRKGRMPVGPIAHLTSLKPRQVRECLVVMIQHNIAVYAEALERNRIQIYYEVNRTELMHRALIPKVLHYSQKWFENEGQSIALTILTHGKLTVVDCLREFQLNAKSSVLVTGRSEAQKSLAVKKAFTKMVKEKFLIAVKPSDSLTAADKDMADEKRETDKMALPPTAAELATIRASLEAQKQREQTTSIVGLKRSIDSSSFEEEGDKRRRLMTDGDLIIVEEVEPDVYFKINYDRFIIRWRNMQVASLYEARLNSTARKIMNAILNLSEDRMININEDFTSPISTSLLLGNLPTDINLVDTLEFDPQELGSNNAKPRVGECLEKYLHILEDDRMQILKKDSGRSGQYIVSLKAASKILKKNLIQDIVSTRFGSPYVRIMNMLIEKGKLEEKQISRYSMMPVKDVREKLTTLCTFGILNLQEVPKTNDRAPSRTYYLWEVLLPRTADSLVDRLYHTMGNLRQRRFVEKSKRAVLLEKCERTDVQDDDRLLNAAEKKELDTLNNVLEMLEVQELRIAEMVVTLKEL
ncbi:DNA-directed RNA polymerase III subunit RPC3 [Entomortierella beljakovae]|nr:DNA-directed RNA polymerase III subunit RPC3 [Entomortierella beljakovae]